MAGMVAALAAALFAMVWAATRGRGLYTAVSRVTAVVEPGPLGVSLREAADGWRYY